MTAILSSNARYSPTYVPTDATRAPVTKAARLAQVYTVFPQADYGSIQQRYIHNPNAAGSFWIAFGQDPVVNGEGSFEVAPGGRWADAITTEVRVLFTAAAQSIAAYER